MFSIVYEAGSLKKRIFLTQIMKLRYFQTYPLRSPWFLSHLLNVTALHFALAEVCQCFHSMSVESSAIRSFFVPISIIPWPLKVPGFILDVFKSFEKVPEMQKIRNISGILKVPGKFWIISKVLKFKTGSGRWEHWSLQRAHRWE